MRKKRVEISLIIPVFNVKKTLKRCMDSVLDQTYDNYEIILVDDGSTDGSEKLCDQYNHIEKVTVIHKENGGLGSARNAGIDIAVGRYICFIDSDDYIKRDYIFELYKSMTKNNSDIVVSGYILKQNKHYIENSPKDIVGYYSGRQYYNFLLEFAKGNSYLYFAWNKLYKRSLIVENNIRFIDRHCAEDMMFNSQYYAVARTISIIRNCIYIYTIENINSLSNKRRSGFWEDMKLVFNSYKLIYKNTKISTSQCRIINNLTFVLLRNTISNYISNEKIDINKTVSFVKGCCEDKIVIDSLSNVFPQGMTGRIFIFFVRKRKYKFIIYGIRVKTFVKWHMFRLFSFLRKN